MDLEESKSDLEEPEVPLLFEQNYLDYFHRICKFPKNTRILCKQDFIAWWELSKNTRSTRRKTVVERSIRSPGEENIRRERELKVGRALGSFICKNIEKGYSDYTLLNVFAGYTDEYDIAVVVDTRAPGNSLTEKRKKIYGFIISQYGEFKCKPNVFALNLVCANQNAIKSDFTDNPSFGRKLVALYLCSVLRVKDKSINKECVLELGGGVSNISAFLGYIRLGFRADLTMFKDQCITDHESLPMSIDLKSVNNISTKSLTRSNRGKSRPSIYTAIINAAIGKHIIEYTGENGFWKNTILMGGGEQQTARLKQIESDYYDQLRPLVAANPTAYSESVKNYFNIK